MSSKSSGDGVGSLLRLSFFLESTIITLPERIFDVPFRRLLAANALGSFRKLQMPVPDFFRGREDLAGRLASWGVLDRPLFGVVLLDLPPNVSRMALGVADKLHCPELIINNPLAPLLAVKGTISTPSSLFRSEGGRLDVDRTRLFLPASALPRSKARGEDGFVIVSYLPLRGDAITFWVVDRPRSRTCRALNLGSSRFNPVPVFFSIVVTGRRGETCRTGSTLDTRVTSRFSSLRETLLARGRERDRESSSRLRDRDRESSSRLYDLDREGSSRARDLERASRPVEGPGDLASTLDRCLDKDRCRPRDLDRWRVE